VGKLPNGFFLAFLFLPQLARDFSSSCRKYEIRILPIFFLQVEEGESADP
jgi:hypothetical protein